MQEKQTSYLKYALIFSSLLMVVKFVAFYITGSNTILSDGLESVINVAAGSFALWSMYLSLQPRDANHPYGHGKIEFLSSGVEGAMIIFAGLGIIIKSGVNILDPKVISSLDTGLILIAITGVLNYLVGYKLKTTGKKENSLILESNGKHLMTDAYSTAGILVGLLVIYLTHIYWLDDLFAIIFGLLIIYTGVKIIRKSIAGVMDEADFVVLKELVRLLNKNRKPEWIDIHNLRTIKYGPVIHVDCHVTLPWYWEIDRGHDEIETISSIINQEFGRKVEFFIHVDPCHYSMCTYCLFEKCPKRKNDFTEAQSWEIEALIMDK